MNITICYQLIHKTKASKLTYGKDNLTNADNNKQCYLWGDNNWKLTR